MSSNVYDDVTGFEVCGFPEIKNLHILRPNILLPLYNKIHSSKD